MTETRRIRWEPTQYGGWTGHVGTLADTSWLFQIWSAASVGGVWQLDSTLPGRYGQHSRADDPATLKADAEFLLSEFVSSLGAVFPDPATTACLVEAVFSDGRVPCTLPGRHAGPHAYGDTVLPFEDETGTAATAAGED